MAYRNNNNRRNGGGGNFGNNFGGRVNPWDSGMGGGQRGNQNSDALTLANSLINNLLRNQNSNQVPPSLLDIPNRFDDLNGFGYMRGNNNRSGRPYNRNNFNNKQGAALKGGIRKPNAFARSKNVLAKNSQNYKSDSSDKPASDDEKSGKSSAKKTGNASTLEKIENSLYKDIPNDFLYCHMCDKHMYDCLSFDNHLTGRTHHIMKDSIEESYRIQATLLRQEARICEQLKTIEIERLKRTGKGKLNHKQREYCHMCELYFYGHISAHRKSEKHLDLKKFLHPKCDDCTLEFHNRTEFDEHILSAEHMRNAKTKPNKLDMERRKNQLQLSTEADELQDLREDLVPREKKENKKVGAAAAAAAAAASTKTEDKDKAATAENGEAKPATAEDGDEKMEDGEETKGDEEEEKEEVVVKKEEAADVILDFKEGDILDFDIDGKLPRYDKTRPLGMSLIAKLECIECRICNKYFDSVSTGEIHSRTHTHFRSFLRLLSEKANEIRIAQKRAAAALDEVEKRKKQKLDAETTAAAKAVAKKESENGKDAADKKEGDLYDPSEATGDDNDVKSNESGDASMADDVKVEDSNGQNESQAEPMVTDEGDAKKDATAAEGAAVKVEPKTPAKDEEKAGNQKGGNNSNRGNRRGRTGRYGGRY